MTFKRMTLLLLAAGFFTLNIFSSASAGSKSGRTPLIQVFVTPQNPVDQCAQTIVSFQLTHPREAAANNSRPVLGYILLFDPQTLPSSCRSDITKCVSQATSINVVNNIQAPSFTVGPNTAYDDVDVGFIYFYANTKSVTSIIPSHVVSLNFQECTVPLNAPSNLSAVLQGNTSIQLTWTDNSQDELEFRIERSAGNTNNFEEIAQVGANVTTYPDENLLPGTSYYYRVRAHNNAGYSPYSNIAGTTTLPQVQTTTTISQYGITWNFAQPAAYGQFANGDYWVVGPVSITGITPNYTGTRNGWQVNPAVAGTQGFDSRAPNFTPSLVPSLSVSNPYIAQPGSSIIKSISCPEADPPAGDSCRRGGTVTFSQLRTVAVLTVVAVPPPDNGATVFRPPYVGTEKPYYSTATVINRASSLPSYERIPSAPSLQQAERMFQRVQTDHIPGYVQRYSAPVDNRKEYGADYAGDSSTTLLALFFNDPVSAKIPALISYVQSSIDHKHMMQLGAVYTEGGGQGPGRKLQLATGAYFLNDAAMGDLARDTTKFHEDNEMRYSQTANNNQGESIYGGNCFNNEYSYWLQFSPTPAGRGCKDPYGLIDGGQPGVAYQVCCSRSGWQYTSLVLELMPSIAENWGVNLTTFKDYNDRYNSFGHWTQPDTCAPFTNMSEYGVTFGPDGNGGCIQDTDPLDGTGRFSGMHGVPPASGFHGYSDFGRDMWAAHHQAP